MLQDIINPHQEQLRLDEITSSLGAQIVDFCEFDLFSETNIQQNNSEVASNSNGCYDDQSSYPTNYSLTPEDNNNKYSSSLENVEIKPTTTTMTSSTTITSKLNLNDDDNTTTTTIDPSNDNNFSLVFDSRGEIENDDICNSIDFNHICSNNYSIAPTHLFSQQEQFDISSLNNPSHHATTTTSTNMVMGTSSLNHQFNNNNNSNIFDPPPLISHPHLPPVFEDECISSLPSYYMKSLNNSSLPSSSLIDPTIGSYISNALSTDISMNPAALYFGSGLPPHYESDFQGNNNSGGSFGHDHNMQRLLNCTNDLQAFSNENQHHMKGSPVGPLTPEITNLEDSNFKVGKLSVEERKEKIQRYMRKRNQRNFSKKIKYACRKTLADSRPRVRGRFAKNDELIAAARAALIHHEEEIDEECRQIGVVKEEEEDMAHTTDILAHLSGVTSFNCNNSINPIHSLL